MYLSVFNIIAESFKQIAYINIIIILQLDEKIKNNRELETQTIFRYNLRFVVTAEYIWV